MTDYNIEDINVNIQFQNDFLNKTLLETRVLVNSLDNEIEKLKLENNRLKEQVHNLTIIKEKYEPLPNINNINIIKHIDTQTQEDTHTQNTSYLNIFSYFKK